MFQQPAQGGMTSLVGGDALALLLCHDAGAFLQSAHDAIDSVHEVLLLNEALAFAGSDQRSLVADIGDIRSREAWRLTGQELSVHAFVDLNGT